MTDQPTPSAGALDVLLRHAGRRLRAARVGRALVVGGGTAAAILFVAALSRPTSTSWWWLTAAVVPIGCACITFFRSRVSAIVIAQHIDTSLGLQELLSSAVAMRGRTDAASQSIITLAEQSASAIDPRRVPAGFPRRETTAATALVAALAAISLLLATPSTPRPAASLAMGRDSDIGDAHSADTSSVHADATPSPKDDTPGGAEQAEGEAKQQAGGGQNRSEPTRVEDAEGAGRASSADLRQTDAPRFDTGTAIVDSQTPPTGSGAGIGGQVSDVLSGTAARSSLNAADPLSPASQGDARNALRDGKVPDRCRDLVRAYFDLPDKPDTQNE